MDPFDLPPSTPPISTDPPEPAQPGRRRGRMAIVAVAAVGLVAGGVAGVSQLASADRSEPAAGTPDDDATAPIDPVGESDGLAPDEESSDEPADELSDGPSNEPAADDDERSADPAPSAIDGEIVIDVGDGEPIVIHLGEIMAGDEAFDEFAACAGIDVDVDAFPVPPFDRKVLPLDPLDELDGELLDGELGARLDELLDDLLDDEGRFGLPPLGGVVTADATHVTIIGPDGVSIVDLGDGDGSVTISRQDGEVTITTEGDATVEELEELFGELPIGELAPGAPLDEFLDGLPRLDEAIGELDLPDRETIEECLDLLRDR